MYGLVWTDDVHAKRAHKNTHPAARILLGKCSCCGRDTAVEGSQSAGWHLFAECTDPRAVKLRKKLFAKIKELVRRILGESNEAITAPWMLDSQGRWHDLGSTEQFIKVLSTGNAEEDRILRHMAAKLGTESPHWREQSRLAAKGMLGAQWRIETSPVTHGRRQ